MKKSDEKPEDPYPSEPAMYTSRANGWIYIVKTEDGKSRYLLREDGWCDLCGTKGYYRTKEEAHETWSTFYGGRDIPSDEILLDGTHLPCSKTQDN